MNKEPRFAIGTQFKSRGRHARICTVTDIFKTFNAAGELVKIVYQAEHEFMGQKVVNSEVPDTTIALGLLKPLLCVKCHKPVDDRITVICPECCAKDPRGGNR